MNEHENVQRDRWQLVGLAVVIVVALIVGAIWQANKAEAAKRWKPCKYEDSVNCVWDARHMGNGRGDSFKVFRSGKVVYINHREAHRLLFR